MNSHTHRAASNGHMRFARALWIAIGLIAASPALTQIYKYRDSQGRLVYSDHPPATGTAEKIQIKSPPPASHDDTVNRQAEQLSAWRQAESERAERTRQEADVQNEKNGERERRCKAARRQMAEFGVDGRKYRFDADNKKVYYSSAEIDQKRAEAKAQLSQYCPPQSGR